MIALALVAAQLSSPSVAPACPSLAAVPRLTRYGPTLRADLDRDGRLERVWIAAAPRAPGRCGIFVVAHDGRRHRVARVPPFIVGPASRSLDEGLPRITASIPFGAPDQRVVAVQVNRGAHAAHFVLYRAEARRLVRGVDGQVMWNVGLLNFGNVDCFRHRRGWELRQYDAWQVRPRLWEYNVTTFRLERRRIRAVRVSRRGDRRDVSRVQAGFSAAPFGRCR